MYFEVDRHDKPVWQYVTNLRPGSNPAPLPTRAVRLVNGNKLISDQFNDQVIEMVDIYMPDMKYGDDNLA